MNTFLLLENVFIDIEGKLRRGSVELTPSCIRCKPKSYQNHVEVKIRHLTRIEDVFTESRSGIRLSTSLGDFIRFGPLNDEKLEEARKFMSEHWRKRVIKLDTLTKSWVFRDLDINELEEEERLANVSNSSSHSSEDISQKIKNARKKWPIKSAVKAKVNFKTKFQQICKHSPKVKRFRQK